MPQITFVYLASREPFQVNFISDDFEFENEATAVSQQSGLKLMYIQDSMNCPSLDPA